MKQLNERPKQLLPNGKWNPEYTKWYRSTEKGKQHAAKNNKRLSEKYREEFPHGSRKCVECNSMYHTPDVVSRGWKIIGNFGCLCDICE